MKSKAVCVIERKKTTVLISQSTEKLPRKEGSLTQKYTSLNQKQLLRKYNFLKYR